MAGMPNDDLRGASSNDLLCGPPEEDDPYEEYDLVECVGQPALVNERFVGDPALAGVLEGKALRRGMRGAAVKRVQRALVDLGFALPGSADGKFGPLTAKALRNFQAHAKKWSSEIEETGALDAPTLRALDEVSPPPGERGQAKHLPVPFFEGKRLRVVVVKDEHRTFLFDRRGHLQGIFLNAVGAVVTPTAEGLKVISAKLDEEAATEVGMRLWEAPVFGARIVDLSWADGKRSGEELHGTIVPAALGADVSHGCVRHANEDIIAIYDAVSVGDKVAIVGRADDPRLHD